MQDIREIIAKNISELRSLNGMTQSGLAELLNYSDKAVSKWERAESVPDIAVLKSIADVFGVTVDYLITDSPEPPVQDKKRERAVARNRLIVSSLAVMLVWLIATFLFVELQIVAGDARLAPWIMFIYAIPASAVVALVFNAIWGIAKINYLIISLLVWSLFLSLYLTLLLLGVGNLWLIFFLGVPAQVIILLWSGLTPSKKIKKLKR